MIYSRNSTTLFSVPLALYIAVSAFLKRISAVSPSAGYMAIPILTLIERTIPLNSQASAIRLTIFSARRVTSASCLTSNNRHTNSSPPQRLTVSSSRMKDCQTVCHHEQHLVSQIMTIRVVNALEFVDVNKQDGESPTVPFCLDQPLVETLFK